jgi:pimeloyl-ACP methyl ester carboxylesterase
MSANDIGTFDYHGYTCREFVVDGCAARLVKPSKPRSELPWVWRAEFWDDTPGLDIAMLEQGFHVAYIEVGNTFGCPDALAHWNPFYEMLTSEFGLSRQPVLEGLSRGGLYVYRWAASNPEKVGCIVGDNPVCDFKSWPGGCGRGEHNTECWEKLIKDYHFDSESEALAFGDNPIDILEPIAAAGIPVIHMCGDADEIVPMEENTSILRQRYMALGGQFVLVLKRGAGHHPHGLSDPAPVVRFLLAVADGAPLSDPQPGSILFAN